MLGVTELGIGVMVGPPLHGIPQRPATGHRMELCIDVEDAEEAVEALRSRGFKIVLEPADQPWGERAAFVEDPDGKSGDAGRAVRWGVSAVAVSGAPVR